MEKQRIKTEEKEAEKIINSEAFKGLIKAGFTERKAFKIMRGY